MKKTFCIRMTRLLLIMCAVLLLCACAGGKAEQAGKDTGASAAGMSAEENAQEAESGTERTEEAEKERKADATEAVSAGVEATKAEIAASEDAKAEAKNAASAEASTTEDAADAAEEASARLLYMGHASIRITTADGKAIYIDPYVGNGYEPAADLILVTHSHYDHNGLDKVANRNPDCEIITWKEALANGTHQTFDLGYAAVEAVEAGYNAYHDVRECVGYIVTLSDGVSVYVTGDTSKTEQMPLLAEKEIDYAFFCCDGVYNMDLDEAAECAREVGAKHNVPYHVVPAQGDMYFDRNRAEQFDAPGRLIIEAGEEIDLKQE